MRHTADDQLCITTVMVKANGDPRQAELQHQVIAQALLAGTASVQAPARWQNRSAPQRRPHRREWPRAIYLLASLVFLAGAVIFGCLAVK